MSKDKKPIIVVKKVKKAHAGHHGGSWKVAYADFVTAMMAFFMVMWILGMDESTRKSIESYFSHPLGGAPSVGSGLGISPIPHPASTAGETKPFSLVTRRFEEQRFEELGERIKERLEGPDGLGELSAQVEVVITDEGLRIELVEGKDGELFFEFGSAVLKPAAARALKVIASELRTEPGPVVVEGHTDSAPLDRRGYTNWELSADRANAARRSLEGSGLGTRRLREVRGLADRFLRIPDNPLDPANRRISVLLPFITPPADTQTPAVEQAPVGGKVSAVARHGE